MKKFALVILSSLVSFSLLSACGEKKDETSSVAYSEPGLAKKECDSMRRAILNGRANFYIKGRKGSIMWAGHGLSGYASADCNDIPLSSSLARAGNYCDITVNTAARGYRCRAYFVNGKHGVTLEPRPR